MRVVLVEPQPASAEIVGRMLESQHHEVRIFADGREALDCVKNDPGIGAVITASAPHSIDGLELCRQARQVAGSRRPIYVMLMSARQGDDRLAVALDHGADDVLNHPPRPDELCARLRAAERLGNMQRELVRLAVTDPLTGMYNRRGFFEGAVQPCQRAERGTSLCAIMADIDHFKSINDRFGHDAGDKAIFAVAHELMGGPWQAGRLGGEEFALLLEGSGLGGVVATADRLRMRIAALRIPSGDSAFSLACSFGVSEWSEGDDIDRLLRRADMALYEAKLGGRNRTVAADPRFESQSYAGAGRAVRAKRRDG